MGKKNEDFYSQAMRLAQTDAARQLMALLQSGDQTGLQNAMQKAAAGDLAGAKEALGQLMADPEAAALVRKLQEDTHG